MYGAILAESRRYPGPMSHTTPAAPTAGDVTSLFGLVAYTQLATFGRFAADAAAAGGIAERQALSGLAAAVFGRQTRLLDRLTESGADAPAALAQFDGVLDDFDARTKPGSWWEGVLKGYLGYGVAEDFCRLLAGGLPDADREAVTTALDSRDIAEFSVAMIGAAVGADQVLAARLALWGRRVVGEALGVVQTLLATRPEIARILAASDDDDGAAAGGAGGVAAGKTEANPYAWVFSRLTAEHTRRMGRLGLAA